MDGISWDLRKSKGWAEGMHYFVGSWIFAEAYVAMDPEVKVLEGKLRNGLIAINNC